MTENFTAETQRRGEAFGLSGNSRDRGTGGSPVVFASQNTAEPPAARVSKVSHLS